MAARAFRTGAAGSARRRRGTDLGTRVARFGRAALAGIALTACTAVAWAQGGKAVPSTPRAESDATTIAAAISRGARVVVVAASHGAVEVRRAPALHGDPPGSEVLSRLPDGQQLELSLQNGRLVLAGRALDGPGVSLVAQSAGGRLRTGGREWPDRLDIVVDGESLLVINYAPLEAYVAGVVAGEMPKDWPAAALQAQAVASRSYALFQKMNHPKGARFDVEISVTSQVYVGGRVTPGVRAAVAATRGEVLTLDRAPINALFHACCGGRTEGAGALWHQDLPYITSVPCEFDSACPLSAPWTRRLQLSQVTWRLRKARLLPSGASRVTAVRVVEATDAGRATAVEIDTVGGGTRRARAEELRAALGYDVLPSNAFALELEDGALVAKGRGSGHGAGMCQWGANGMALAGKTHREILEYYYPGTTLRRLY